MSWVRNVVGYRWMDTFNFLIKFCFKSLRQNVKSDM